MKLDNWVLQYRMLEINKSLPPDSAWPLLPELLAALETFPRVSKSHIGTGIFLGWRDGGMQWVYHHGICVPGPEMPENMYDFHSYWNEENVRHAKIIPTMNIGGIPESADFLSVLKRVGFRTAPIGNTMVRPRLRARPGPKTGGRRSQMLNPAPKNEE